MDNQGVPIDDFLELMIASPFKKKEKEGYVRTCPLCGGALELDDDGVYSCPKGHYRHP